MDYKMKQIVVRTCFKKGFNNLFFNYFITLTFFKLIYWALFKILHVYWIFVKCLLVFKWTLIKLLLSEC